MDSSLSLIIINVNQTETSHRAWEYNNKAEGDYHSAMDSDQFKSWVNESLGSYLLFRQNILANHVL